MEELLKIDNLFGGYRNQDVLKGVTIALNRGDFLGIIGPNGSGKTTLLRLISKILNPSRGEVSLEGKDIRTLGLKEFCRLTAFVQQDTALNFPFSVFEIVLMGRIPHLKRLQSETRRDLEIAENALRLTDTYGLRDKRIDELSSGERQRVLIAKALAQEPKLLFLDEPTSHLDIGHQIQILDLLRKLNRKTQLSIVMVLHDLNLVSEYCNRVALLEEGRIFSQGDPEKVLTYQNIESVYKTVVVVNQNPVSKKPNVILVSQENIDVH